mgnify:FL=1
MAGSRTSYHRQYYRKQAMDDLRNTIKNLRQDIKIFMQSPEGIAYKKRKQKEYAVKYREKNKDKLNKYQKEYHKLYG